MTTTSVRKKLSDEIISKKIENLPEWSYVDNKLRVEYSFTNFIEAFSFMTQAALISEKLNHHPNWSNVFKTVAIDLFTHDAGGVTELDFAWAEKVSAIYSQYL